MSEKKTQTDKEEGKGQQTKKADLDDTYIGPTDPVHDDEPRHRGPRRRG